MLASVLALLQAWLLLQVAGLTAIAESNRLSRSAAEAMAKGHYAAAARDYSRMADELGVKDDAVLANLGQAYMRQNDYANATRAYTRLSLSKDAGMRSLAHAQLGVVAGRQKNPGEAINQFKEALRQDPNNQLARLNLTRMLKRNPKLDPPPKQNEQQKQQQKQQEKQKQEEEKRKQDQQNQQNQKEQDQQGRDKKPEPGKEGQQQDQADKQGQGRDQKPQGQTQQGQTQNRQGTQGQGRVDDDPEGKGNQGKKPVEDPRGTAATREQVQKMQMSEERSRQLLEAMRSSEVQYLQQRRHRRNAPSAGSGKPDW